MAIITFDKREFEHEIGKLDEKMQNQIAMFGTPIEKIDDKEIQIEVFPNRPDLLSYHGFKRSFLSFLGKKTGLKSYKLYRPEKNYVVKIDSSVKEVRPYTVCAIIKGIKFDDERIKELIEVQEKLHITIGRKRKKAAIGIYPLEKIRLPITFKAVEPDQIRFMPLDSDREMSGLEILQKHSAGKEYAHLLAGKAKFPIFEDADKQILSLPPIINSHRTGKVTGKTRDVFVECSGFDLDTLKMCLNILVTTMADMGGKIYQMEISRGLRSKEVTPNLDPGKMRLLIKDINKLLGLDLKEKESKQLLEKMGYGCSIVKNSLEVNIPAWRTDILHPVDLIEDIAIAYGYDNFVPEIPEISTIGDPDGKAIIKKKMAEILSGIDALEVSNYHLTSKKDQTEKMGVSEKKADFIDIAESKTDYNELRGNITHYLLKNLSENVDAEYPQKIFEMGKVFKLKGDKIIEKEMLAMAVSPGNFTEIKQVLEYVLRMAGKSKDLKGSEPLSEIRPDWFIEGRTEEIFWKGKSIGFLGEIHPKILRNWKIKMPVALFEIEIEDLLKELVKA